MKKGFIKKSISNQYTIVDLEHKTEIIAQAKGKFRYMKVDADSSFAQRETKRTKIEQKMVQISPKVGDVVLYDDLEDQVVITEILPRKNDLARPDVCNVDQVLLVFSIVNPEFSFHLLDKFLIILNQQGMSPVIVISKIDLTDEQTLTSLKKDMAYYIEKLGYDVYYVNSKERIGIDVLTHIFKDKITVLAGQTGVGKSTLLNALMPYLGLKTQEISKALGRGKHTTRHTELYDFNEGYIVDTPGFSKIEFKIFYPEDLKAFYPDFEVLSDGCRFGSKCNHMQEPGCAIKKAIEDHKMIDSRYENYQTFYQEIKMQKPMY